MAETLNERSIEIFRQVVDAYVETGEPVGSKALVDRLSMRVSSATIRSCMARLEDLGLLCSKHTSSGRMPTEEGLRFFVNGILETRELEEKERQRIEKHCQARGMRSQDVLADAVDVLSGLSSCASLVLAPKKQGAIRHVEFVLLDDTHSLFVCVDTKGNVENRLIKVAEGVPPSALVEASNYINHYCYGKTLDEARRHIRREVLEHKKELTTSTQEFLQSGLGVWGETAEEEVLIVRGQSHLLQSVDDVNDLDNVREIFSLLERKESLLDLLDASIQGEGIQIFIGAENELFQHTGCSMVLSSYADGDAVGTIGVIGPSRMNYRRIIPVVDYTAKVVGRILSRREEDD